MPPTQERNLSSAQRREEAAANVRIATLKEQNMARHQAVLEATPKKSDLSPAQRRANAIEASRPQKEPVNFLNIEERYFYAWDRARRLLGMDKSKGVKKLAAWMVLGPALLTMATADTTVLLGPNLAHGAYRGTTHVARKLKKDN